MNKIIKWVLVTKQIQNIISDIDVMKKRVYFIFSKQQQQWFNKEITSRKKQTHLFFKRLIFFL